MLYPGLGPNMQQRFTPDPRALTEKPVVVAMPRFYMWPGQGPRPMMRSIASEAADKDQLLSGVEVGMQKLTFWPGMGPASPMHFVPDSKRPPLNPDSDPKLGSFNRKGVWKFPGTGPNFLGRIKADAANNAGTYGILRGYTKASGAYLGGCTVKIFITATDTLIVTTTSDSRGYFEANVGKNTPPFYAVITDATGLVTGSAVLSTAQAISGSYITLSTVGTAGSKVILVDANIAVRTGNATYTSL